MKCSSMTKRANFKNYWVKKIAGGSLATQDWKKVCLRDELKAKGRTESTPMAKRLTA